MLEIFDTVCAEEKTERAVSDISLIREIQNGNGDAFVTLCERYNYIISYNLSKLYSSPGSASFYSRADSEDLFQECRIILYKAAKRYDYMKNAKFSTFANICVRNYLLSLLRRCGKTGKRAGYNPDFVPLDDLRGSELSICDRYFAPRDLRSLFERDFTLALSVFEKKVLGMYIDDKSYKYMAKILNKSVKSIDNAVCRIKSKLKPYAEYFIFEY
ncbi:MAG: sigma-70 family RNA polymerase sigma factor [Oscillospiraceae bacterium]|nr:sigma-70 family RNA polymerase sigma factor [Oscillospiraceae bacterium]